MMSFFRCIWFVIPQSGLHKVHKNGHATNTIELALENKFSFGVKQNNDQFDETRAQKEEKDTLMKTKLVYDLQIYH